MIAFAVIRNPSDGCDGCSDLYVSAPNGNGRRRLTHDGTNAFPSWSADSKLIAFQRCVGKRKGGCGIYRVRANGTGLTRLTPPGVAGVPAWSPDGANIAFAQGGSGIYVLAITAGKLRRLSRGRDSDPSWSPDGTKIAFTRGISLGPNRPGEEIYVMSADGSGVHRLTGAGPRRNKIALEQAWASDGTRIVFVEEVLTAYCKVAALVSIRPGGAGRKPLTPYRPIYAYPTWSPDGKSIAFVSQHNCSSGAEERVYVMPASGGEERLISGKVVSEGPLGGGPAWQPVPD
jgi:Tol biopolymer transport system component